VKPIHLNLASRPYRDYRPVYAVVVVMSLLTAFLMLNNVETYYRYTHETRATRTKIASVEAQAEQEQAAARVVEQRLETLDLGRLNAQTKFVNAKLAQRAFSWSTLLDELESVVARDVRLIAVSPRFDDEVNLRLNFAAKTAEGMIQTINRMNDDPQFRSPFPSNESVKNGQYTFALSVRYLPPPVHTAGVQVKSSGKVTR
jgi:type IV pilus assembly protein PilN